MYSLIIGDFYRCAVVKYIRAKCANYACDHILKVAIAKEQNLRTFTGHNYKKCIKCDLKIHIEHFGTNCSIEK